MPGGPEDGCQEVWPHQWSGYVSPSRRTQRIIRSSCVFPDVYPSIDTGPQGSKSLSSQAG